jgi:hypothetical protein
VTTVDLYSQLGIDRVFVSQFFIVFSRLEYALKRTGSAKYARGDESRVDANWEAFSAAVESRFRPDETPALIHAIEYIEHRPPKKQILTSQGLDFRPVTDSGSQLERLLLAVRRTRNNLFHGGKFPLPTGPVEEPGRDTALIQSCIVLLERCAALDPEVRRYFLDTQT